MEFTSILAQAQKLIGTGSKERLIQFVGQTAQLFGPDATDTISNDRLISRYSDDLGVPPDVMATPEEMAQKRQARQQQQAAAQQAASMQSAADTAQKLGSADTGGGTLLSSLVRNQAGPQAAASAGLDGTT